MSHITTIMKKEIREMLSPGSVASILIMVVLFAGMGGLIGGEVEKAAALPEFGYIGEKEYGYDGTTTPWTPYKFLTDTYGDEAGKITYLGNGSDDIAKMMQEMGISSVIALPSEEEFRSLMSEGKQITVLQYYIYEPTGMFGSVSSTVMTSIVSLLNSNLSAKLISEGDTPTSRSSPAPLYPATAPPAPSSTARPTPA